MTLKAEISPYSRDLTALLVEDDGASRKLMAAQLRGVFKELILAADGQEGLEAFHAHQPDLVLTDYVMPVLSGIAMTEAIRATDLTVPIIFFTASMDTDLMVHAINLGISSFIPKPVVLGTLTQAVSRVVGLLENEFLQRKSMEQELALLQFREKYHEYQQELAFRKELSILENDFAFHAFRGEVGTGRGEWIAQVEYAPHDIMCGDSYSLRRLGDGSMLVFLADAMGKGLAAAITSSLSVYTFNLQVDALAPEAPFQFKAFTEAYLTLMRKRLLEDEVLPMALAWLPAEGSTLETASFGMPPMLVGVLGEPPVKLRCNNPPVSVFMEEVCTSVHELGQSEALLLYTDGLNEAVTQDGSLYREHLNADFQATASRDQLLAAFKARVPRPDDDVTMILLYRVDAEPLWTELHLMPCRLEAGEEACQELERRLETLPTLGADQSYEFCIAVREAMLNAYEHGSLEVTSALKRRLLDEGGYYDYLHEREADTDREVTVRTSLQAAGGNLMLKVTIEDQGPGFTPPTTWFNEPESMMLSGRGLKMVRKYTDAITFNAKGNAITLFKIFSGGSHGIGLHRDE